MAKEHPSIFKGDILRFHFVTGSTLDLAMIYYAKPEGGSCYLLVNLNTSMVYREFPVRISDVHELKTYHNSHREDNSAVVGITVVRHLCEVF
jgi:hypothetical protein